MNIHAGNEVMLQRLMRFAVAVLIGISSVDTDAQITAGQVVGFNFTNMNLNAEGGTIDTKGATGIHFGLTLPLAVADYFSIMPGVQFSSKGSSYTIDTVDISIAPIYIEIPVNLLLSIGNETFGVTLFGGTYFSCGVGGNIIVDGGTASDILFGSGESNDLKLFDIGINMGTGINIKGFLISAQYVMGLVNLSPVGSAAAEMKNRVVGISLTTSFSGK
jgi:hypothetical protein